MLTKAERAAIKQDYSQIESTFLPVDKRVPRLLTDLEETERLWSEQLVAFKAHLEG